MLNQVVLVGRVKQIREDSLVIAIPGPHKDDEPTLVPCEMEGNVATSTVQYCTPGSIVGVKGKLENKKELVIKVEKITFLASKSED